MRLTKYLNEDYKEEVTTNPDDIVHTIRDNCRQYVKALKGNNPFMRYIRRGIPHDILLKNDTKEYRKPRGIWHEDMKYVNVYLRTNGHLGRDRNVLMAGGEGFDSGVGIYSDPFFIFPIGQLRYTWGEFHDFNMLDDDNKWDGNNSNILAKFLNNEIHSAFISLKHTSFTHRNLFTFITSDEKRKLLSFNYKWSEEEKVDILMRFQKYFISKFHTNEGMLTALKKNYEIWFNCKSYYSLSGYGSMVKNSRIIERILE